MRTSGIIDTVVGGGSGGDGGAATSAVLIYPTGAAADSSGNVFIADQFNFRVRRVGCRDRDHHHRGG